MSKLDIGVGDEFPLDEGGADPRERHGHRHGGHFRHHHMHRGHHHHHGHGFGRFAVLLVIAGLAAPIVEHRLPIEAAYGMIALGLAGFVFLVALRWHHHRHMARAS